MFLNEAIMDMVKRRRMTTQGKGGQSVLEYAVLLSVLAVVIVTMMGYMKNSVWAKLFVVQQRINEAAR